MASITVNGNTIETVGEDGEAWKLITSNDETLKPAANAEDSNFILVRVDHILSINDKQTLADCHVAIQEYVAENTFLCRYEPSDLETIRNLPFVLAADIYHPELKTTISLKSMVATDTEQDHYEVDLIFHEIPNMTPNELAPDVARIAEVATEDMEILPRKIRVTVNQDKLPALATLDSINRIEEVRPYDTYNDQARAVLLGMSALSEASAEYQGTGQVICVADSGFDQGMASDTANIKVHPAFSDRVEKVIGMVKETKVPVDGTGHGTHVCASICGNGYYKNATGASPVSIKGTAPNAKVVVQAMSRWHDVMRKWELKPPADLSILFSGANDLGIKIHNDSFGKKWNAQAGQLGYEADATAIDRFMVMNLDFSILVAGGNDAEADNAGKSQIGDSGAAKNCITVGATGSTRDNDGQRFKSGFKNGSNISSVAIFSSRGPTLATRNANGDLTVGRIKPDVVAPGVAILSAASRALPQNAFMRVACGKSDDPDWMYQSGTSMATPLVSGCVALLRQALQAVGKQRPSAALIKALLINGAVRDHGCEKSVFDYAQGFGRVDVNASLAAIRQLSFVDGCRGVLESTMQDASPLRVTSEAEKTWQSPPLSMPAGRNRLTVTLTYPDPHGALLQNDVNLIVRAGDTERHGNMAGDDQAFDTINNVEKIIWDDVPGTTFVVVVKAQAFAITSVEQTFAVAWFLESI